MAPNCRRGKEGTCTRARARVCVCLRRFYWGKVTTSYDHSLPYEYTHHLNFTFVSPSHSQTNLDGLELRCTNADPNYGVSWFQCRGHPSETARQILRRAKTAMAYEMEALGAQMREYVCLHICALPFLWAKFRLKRRGPCAMRTKL